MIPYIILFLIISIVSIIVESNSEKPKLSKILIILSILMLSVFAACRDYGVGTDVNFYGVKYFNLASYYSFNDYINSVDSEFLYLLLNYIINHIFSNFRIFLFIHQLILATIVYTVAYKNRNKMSFSIFIISYLFIWYCSSFNILRQSLSIFVLFYSFRYLEEHKYFKYYVLNCIAILFHISALIGIVFPFLYNVEKYRSKKVWYVIFIGITVLLIFSFEEILLLLYNSGILTHRYLFYSSHGAIKINFGISLMQLCAISLIYLFDNKNIKYRSKNFLKFIVIFEFIIYQISAFTRFGYRLSYIILPYFIYTFSIVDFNIKNKSNKFLFRLLLIILLIVWWIVRYVYNALDGIYPFKFGM